MREPGLVAQELQHADGGLELLGRRNSSICVAHAYSVAIRRGRAGSGGRPDGRERPGQALCRAGRITRRLRIQVSAVPILRSMTSWATSTRRRL